MMREIGEQAMGILLRSLQSTPNWRWRVRCGGTLTYQRMRPATLVSVFGKVHYERAYYAGCTCQKGKAPLDEPMGWSQGR